MTVALAAAAGWAWRRPAVGPSRLRPPAVAAPGLSDLALVIDLVAAALRAGLPLPLALRAVADACLPEAPGEDGPGGAGTAAGLAGLADGLETGDRVTAIPAPPGLAALVDAVDFAVGSGAPLAPLLSEAARSVRRRRREAAVRAAGRLSASLVLPLGLAALPGFLLLGVAPVVVRLVTDLG
jgi:Flp pilus assembly protein TadB